MKIPMIDTERRWILCPACGCKTRLKIREDTRTLSKLDGTPHVRVDEYMRHRLQNKLIRAILKDSL
ncbi:MAG TPA: helix-turn-helix domain-containing protein [Candidatus Anaerotignum merdipullorum]|nr:helix-turn-helix domain-containing protein [Candidatus Anaerotignum merdipullorum]